MVEKQGGGQTPLGYAPALDGIRGIAIALVVGFHAFGWPPGGTVGVDLFFVLSGFLITTLLLEEHAAIGTIRLRAFYARRARRLFPALAVVVIVYLIATASVGEDKILPAALGISYVGNVAVAFGFSTALYASRLSPLWSLAQEEQFYLIWPLLLLVALRSRILTRLLIGAFVAVVVYRASLALATNMGYRLYYGPDTRCDGLIAGAALAALRREGIRVGETAGKIGLCALVPAALVGWSFRGWLVYGNAAFVVAMASLIGAAISDTALAAALATRPLVWLGKRSYSLYLWHLPIICGVAYVAGDASSTITAAVVASLAVAECSYRFVEQPFRRRRRVEASVHIAAVG